MAKKKKGKKKYDYKKIAKSTRRQTKASSERKGGSGGGIFKSGVKFTKFTPAIDADHTVDFVPFEAGKNMAIDLEKDEPMVEQGEWAYSFEYWQHRNIGPLENERVICIEKTWKEPCPICEHRRELSAEKAFDSQKMSGLLAKRRNLYNVVCYDTEKEEEKGVQLLDVSWHYFEKYLAKLASKAIRRKRGSKIKVADPHRDLGDPTEEGVSIEWSIEGKKGKDDFDDWMGHQLVQREYELDEEYLDAALQLDEVVERLEYAEVYKKYYDEDYVEDEDEEEKPRRGRKQSDRRRSREEEEEVEEEEVEEEDDDLEGLSRKKLKKIIQDEELEVRVKKSMDEDDIREAIREARGDEEEEEEVEEEEKPRRRGKKADKKKTCPQGGTYGADFEEFDECDDCKQWSPCQTVYQDEYLEEDDD